MPLHILDTDHLTLVQRSEPKVSVRYLSLPREDLAASAISYEEQIRGRLAYLSQAKTPEKICRAYALLCQTQRFFCTLRVVEFDSKVSAIYDALRQTHRRLGKMDLRIAATALSVSATLVTRNTQDFSAIADLRLENWA